LLIFSQLVAEISLAAMVGSEGEIALTTKESQIVLASTSSSIDIIETTEVNKKKTSRTAR